MSIRQWVLTAAAAVLAAGCGPGANGDPAAETGAANGATNGAEPTEAAPPAASGDTVSDAAAATEIVPGLMMRVLEEGSGATAATGDTAVVHYTGWLYDVSTPDHRGTKFDSSLDRDQPFEFTLGAGQVIRGWDEGVRGMQVGEIRELTIAPELAYGERATGPIPPGSTLVFQVELLDVKPAESAPTP